jgi:hypothetical protein
VIFAWVPVHLGAEIIIIKSKAQSMSKTCRDMSKLTVLDRTLDKPVLCSVQLQYLGKKVLLY